MADNYYDVLGISPSAQAEEIKKAYRTLAKSNHPDLHPGDKNAEANFKKIGEAYRTLIDSQRRKAYDETLRHPAPARGAEKKAASRTPVRQDFDLSGIGKNFEQFFGFDPGTGAVTDEEKLKKKNPLDASDIFKKYMGFK